MTLSASVETIGKVILIRRYYGSTDVRSTRLRSRHSRTGRRLNYGGKADWLCPFLIVAGVPLPDLMARRLVHSGTANSWPGSGPGAFRDPRPGRAADYPRDLEHPAFGRAGTRSENTGCFARSRPEPSAHLRQASRS